MDTNPRTGDPPEPPSESSFDTDSPTDVASPPDLPAYAPPVDQLLALGEASLSQPIWSDYRQLGLSEADIPELTRLATDWEFLLSDTEDASGWAPIHAARALGQFRAASAITPLFDIYDELDEEVPGHWLLDDLIEVLVRIGPDALSILAPLISDPARGEFQRNAMTEAMKEIAETYPDTRPVVVSILTRQLQQYENNEAGLNGFLIAALVDLKAVETAPLMEKAFGAITVDPMVAGDWHDIQVKLGLKSADEPRQWEASMAEYMESKGIVPWFVPGYEQDKDAIRPSKGLASGGFMNPKKADAKKKAKRRQAAKSRKQNRKRK